MKLLIALLAFVCFVGGIGLLMVFVDDLERAKKGEESNFWEEE